VVAEELLGLDDVDGEVGLYEGEGQSGLKGVARRRGEPVYVLSIASLLKDGRLCP
jgi:hypothetical protein